MALDVEKYLPYLDGYGWSREEKIEILRYVCRMMQVRVDVAHGPSASQSSRGKIYQNSLRNQQKSVDSKHQSLSQFYGEAANDQSYDAISSKGDKEYAK